MKPIDFLRAVWPADGIYCLAVPFQLPGMAKPLYAHKTFTSIEAAVKEAKMIRDQKDVFFCVHTLVEEKVWNPEKLNRKTGEQGAFEVRVQSNMHAGKAFFFDLDVEPGHPKKYETQASALVDIKRFCQETKLPKPLLTSSGGGVHVYWPMTDAIPSMDWKQQAAKLRALAHHHGLRVDPMRTTDQASVLRVVGTFNHKKGEKRPVEALTDAKPTPNGVFLKMVADAIVRAGVTVKDSPLFVKPKDDFGFGSNLDTPEFDGPPVGMKALLTACKQVREYWRNAATASEPLWYQMLNLVRFTENGHKNAHKISAPYSGYAVEDTDAKLAQLESKNLKPTSCLKLAEHGGDQNCEGCPFAGRVKNPLMAARFKDPAPKPVVQQVVGPTTTTLNIPDCPHPFQRGKDGKITRVSTNKEGEEIHMEILGHDLFPLRRITNEAGKTEQHMWRAMLPRVGAKDFTFDADALYERRKFVTAISNRGIFPHPANVEHLQELMIAYIAKLQQEADAEEQFNHLGWIADQTQFIMPDKILLPDGTAKPAMLSRQAETVSVAVTKKGTLEKQVELLRFYKDPGYLAHQFMVMCSLGAPIFFATGHHGVIVNASGDPGASKSTALYTAASLWGAPELYAINGTNSGATTRGRNERITTLANLPICVDEITHIPPKEAQDLAMNITQAGHRIRLDTTGTERAANGGYKATIMLSTANSSLHVLLAQDNSAGTAGSMRVIEIMFQKLGIHSKPEADTYLDALKENYGHVGDAFMAWVVTHRDEVKGRVRKEMALIDVAANVEPSERFWSAGAASAIVAGEIAYELGLLPYDVSLMRRWVLDRLLPSMRLTVKDSYSNPATQLTDYLQSINSKMVIIGAPFQNNDTPNTLATPHGELFAHYDQGAQRMWVLKKAFRDYCVKTGANPHRILQELQAQKVILATSEKKVLGAGTAYAKGQAWCFVIDMSHDEIAGKFDLPEQKTENAKKALRVVEGGKA